VFYVHADTTAIHENRAVQAFAGGIDNHFEATILTLTPDVGGFTALGGFL
jgi:hypothetical protein